MHTPTTPTVEHILYELAQTSTQAEAILARLISQSSGEAFTLDTNQGLKKTIESLVAENSRLLALVHNLTVAVSKLSKSQDVEELTDEQQAAFINTLKMSLSSMTIAEMEFGYSQSIMRSYPQHLRYLVALSLVNSCTLKGIKPIPFWVEILAKQGVM